MLEKDTEINLMEKLEQLGYKRRTDIRNIKDIEQNFKSHLEKINKETLNNKQIPEERFQNDVVRLIKSNSLVENSKLLKDKVRFVQGSGQHDLRLSFFDVENIDNNIFEFSNQVNLSDNSFGFREYNRGDVTIFMNGIPIVQIELKNARVEIDEAFNQISRYKKQSFDNDSIFKMLQIFIVSNSTITKYFSNHSDIDKKFMFYWTDKENNIISNIIDFADAFLNIKTLFKMITKYMIVNEKISMVLRPYQFHAVESILNHIESVKDLNEKITNLDERQSVLNGFVWHATGSGKTVTSFKTSQILSKNKNIDKVIFLVDRLDLNAQTFKEFKKFTDIEDENDLKESKNCKILYQQLINSENKIIITTIQKLSRLLNNEKKYKLDDDLVNKKIIFIIDECHRSQFGDMHKNLKRTFIKSILIGFTGTPIFESDKINNLSTQRIFGKNLHRYMMVNAIRDNNVLKFNIEYIKGLRNKMEPSQDIEVEAIDKEGYYMSDQHVNAIVDYLYKINKIKTKDGYFSSMLVASDIESAIRYFWKFRERHPDFRVATLFSESDKTINEDYVLSDDNNESEETINTNEFDTNQNTNDNKIFLTDLEKIINEYNKLYDKKFDKNDFKAYSSNIQNELSIDAKGHPKIEMIIVVRMLTTGFNAKYLNTVYLDRKIKGYEIIQTISRANRIGPNGKDIANIVSFKTPKYEIDDAIVIYNDNNSIDYILSQDSIDNIVDILNLELAKLQALWPDSDSILNETSDEKKKEFVNLMKYINKLINNASSFIEYDWSKVEISSDKLESYRGVMRSFKNDINNSINKESILNDVDFDLDILEVNEINTDYILNKLSEVKKSLDGKLLIAELNKVHERIEKSGLKSKYKLLEEFTTHLISEISDDEDKDLIDWKTIDFVQLHKDFKMRKISPKISQFSELNGLDKEGLINVIEQTEEGKKNDKTINDFESEIKQIIINKSLTTIERNKLTKEIKNFILEISNY